MVGSSLISGRSQRLQGEFQIMMEIEGRVYSRAGTDRRGGLDKDGYRGEGL